ncbi:SDR family oxidoreductase [Aeromicrobium sp. SMF47]|uniref:SDR family oxidoreductase n=1 Tax=Aeromicrobium yanjiei TaxID=2662028 RepID=UPI00129D48EF|nr:SDR family oxidoreductase [Aeromicrobium yanjiei]MRJ77279.1 SDR family oxidoreductase [Aeromicrobium yanjiei]
MTGLPKPPALGATALPAGTYAGQVVLVTGGGTGLGKAMAVEFARLGASVAIASRREEHRASGVAAIEAVGGRGLGVEVDVREPEQVAAAFDLVESELGPIDVLINNAAGNFQVPAEELSINGWRAVTGIVLDGTFICSTELARRAKAAGRPASILNIGATYSWTGGPGTSPSAAAKAGVTNLTQSLAVEWAPFGIRVNCLAPGTFPHDDHPTALLALRNAGSIDPAERIPAGRVGELHELGWAATFMCSPYATYLSGHTLVLDGANWLRRGLRMPLFVPLHEQIAHPETL